MAPADQAPLRPQGHRRRLLRLLRQAGHDHAGGLPAEGAETTLLLLQLNNRALSRRQRLEIRRIDPKTRIEKHNWNDLRQLCMGMAGESMP